MLKRLFCCAALLGLVACVDPKAGGSTGYTTLYAYDNAAPRVLFWGDLPGTFTTGGAVTPTAIMTSGFFANVTPLAWGGMVMDSTRNRLYLLGETGNLVRLDSVRGLSGSVSNTNVVTFKLDSTGRLDGGKFGQMALDSANDTLYITENGTGSAQIWVVTGASTRAYNSTVTLQAMHLGSDSGGYGVAANANVVYGSMENGDSVGTSPVYTGYRLRKGTSSGFDPNQVLIGDQTGLGKYASLALDGSNNILYVGLDAGAFTGATHPVLAYKTGQFGGTVDQAPDRTLGDTGIVSDLRVLAHPGNKDWLVGLSSSADNTLWTWKNPSSGSSASFKTLAAPAGSQLRGVALDGTP